MSYRIIHRIDSECDVHVSKTGGKYVRVRITEVDPEHPNPVDFEIEGDPVYIAEALGTITDVLLNLDAFNKEEPN